MTRSGVIVTAALLAAGAARADVVSQKPDAVTVTLYHEGTVDTAELIASGGNNYGAFAFITETRSIDLPAGSSVIRFRGVASTMVPQSASIAGLPQGALEKNFDYDLLSPGSLLLKSLGKTVHLVRTDPKTGKETSEAAIVRAATGGAVLDIGGRIEALHCGGPPERLVFDEIPQDLSDTPTFSVRATSPKAGRYTVTLAYIATRMNWSADYVARISENGDTLELTGWLTLANFSDTTFTHAPTQVVAGHPNTTGDDIISIPPAAYVASQCWPLNVSWATYPMPPPPPPPEQLETVRVTGSRIPQAGVYSASPVTAVSNQEIRAENLGEYKLYPLPEPTTVAARQTKQVQFLDRPKVKFERVYAYTSSNDTMTEKDTSEPAIIRYRMKNKEEEGLGKPLPAGTVSVLVAQADGRPVLAGQEAIADMPVGLPIEIDTGRAIDVNVDRHVVAFETRKREKGHRVVRETLAIGLSNAKPVPVRFELTQSVYFADSHVVDEDRPHTMDEGQPKWSVTLPAHQQMVLHYTVEYNDFDYVPPER